MPDESITRKLTAILYADVAGYSRLTGTDEVGTHKQLSAALNLISGRIEEAGGRVVHYAGDAVLAEFQSVVKAVETAVGIQLKLAEDGAGIADDKRLRFRIGVNLGEVIVDRDDIYGDGVNVAARLESLAEPGGISVSGAVHEQVKGKLDVGFEDMGAQEVKNIAQPIHVYRIPSSVPAPSADGEEAAAGTAAAAKPTVAEKPSIAVLPFDNMSADPEQDFFADGLTEDILTQLSRFSGLFVISRTSTFAYKGKSVTARDVARELGVRYVVEGSVRKAGNRVRVTVQLIDGTNDRHVWAERYDRDLEDIFAIQDAITAAITATLPGRIEADSHDRARQIPTDNLQAYECVLAGKVLHHRSNRGDNKEAVRLLERAIVLDPGYAHARAWRACVLGQSWIHGWIDSDDSDAVLGEIEAELERALALDENDADTHRILAAIYITRRDIERALVHQEKALRLNPNYDLVVVQYGELMTWLGRAEEDIEWIQKAMQINPFHPQRFWSHLGRAFFVARRYRDAIDAFRHIEKNIPMNHAFMAASFAYLDDDAEAAAHGREVLKLSPDFNIGEHMTTQHHAQDSDRAHHAEGLLKAGLPAG